MVALPGHMDVTARSSAKVAGEMKTTSQHPPTEIAGSGHQVSITRVHDSLRSASSSFLRSNWNDTVSLTEQHFFSVLVATHEIDGNA